MDNIKICKLFMNKDALSFGFTHFPHETFSFYALANGITDTHTELNFSIAGLEELNQQVLSCDIDICKASANILPYVLNDYIILRAGASLGHGCGPIIVSTHQDSLEKLSGRPLAIPGELTTAHMLLMLNGAHSGPFVPMAPHEILKAVSSGQVDAGLVIHEARYFLEDLGLHIVLDLGSWWETATGLPLPLGVIVMRRSLGNEMHLAMEKAIRESILRAQGNPGESRNFILAHAKDTCPEIISGLIRSYVNEFTTELGPEGEAAVKAIIKQSLSLIKKTLPENLMLFPEG